MIRVTVLALLMAFSVSVFANPEMTNTYNQVTTSDGQTQNCQTTCQNDMCSTYCL
jgi:hypothetical protein